jgi:phospholipase/lecithinase/hemolysin
VNNPSAYGFTHVTSACYTGSLTTLCANPSQYLFFDDFHPTTAAHAIIAQGFLAAVPEPSTLLLMGFGVVLLFPKRRRS